MASPQAVVEKDLLAGASYNSMTVIADQDASADAVFNIIPWCLLPGFAKRPA